MKRRACSPGPRRTGQATQNIDRVLDELEQTACAGLAPDRYAWVAVQHCSATGGVHVHVLTVRCDLLDRQEPQHRARQSGSRPTDPLVESPNLAPGLEPPGRPRREPGSSSRGTAPTSTAAELRAGIAREDDPRAAVRDYLLQRVEHGTVQVRVGRRRSPTRGGLRRAATA